MSPSRSWGSTISLSPACAPPQARLGSAPGNLSGECVRNIRPSRLSPLPQHQAILANRCGTADTGAVLVLSRAGTRTATPINIEASVSPIAPQHFRPQRRHLSVRAHVNRFSMATFDAFRTARLAPRRDRRRSCGEQPCAPFPDPRAGSRAQGFSLAAGAGCDNGPARSDARLARREPRQGVAQIACAAGARAAASRKGRDATLKAAHAGVWHDASGQRRRRCGATDGTIEGQAP